MSLMRVGLLATSICLSGFAGCGTRHAEVADAVTYDGAPIPAGAIALITADSGGRSGGGTILDGKYTVPPHVVLPPGRYRVEIRWAKPTGKKFKSETGEMLERTQEGLPAKYNDQSTLAADISAGKNTIDFHLAK